MAGRYISIDHINRRWLALPLTNQEAAAAYPELSLVVRMSTVKIAHHNVDQSMLHDHALTAMGSWFVDGHELPVLVQASYVG